MMPKLINWELVRNPFNWVLIVAVAFFGIMAIHLVTAAATGSTATKDHETA
jgi:hypothetical protein